MMTMMRKKGEMEMDPHYQQLQIIDNSVYSSVCRFFLLFFFYFAMIVLDDTLMSDAMLFALCEQLYSCLWIGKSREKFFKTFGRIFILCR